MPDSPAAAPRSARPRWVVPVLVVVVLAAVGVGIFLWAFGGDEPDEVDLGAAVGALQSEQEPSTDDDPAAGPSADEAPPADERFTAVDPSAAAAVGGGAPVDDVDGTWAVDTSVGDFADFTSSFAGFRVAEELAQGIGATTAVGRTPEVTGTLSIAGTTLEAADLEVDLTGIVSDRDRREDAIQRALETSRFPTATFTLSEPVDLGAIPAQGEVLEVRAPGVLTIHGVARDVVVPLQAQLVGDVIAVVGQLPIGLADHDVRAPSAPIVVSVADQAVVEVQLFFTRA